MLLENDHKFANEKFENLLDVIQNDDIESLSLLFSPSGKNDDFNKFADELCNYFVGSVLSYEDWGGPYVEVDSEQGSVKKIMESSYDVITTEYNYRFAIRYIVRNDTKPENIGIESLYIINSKDDTLLEYAYLGDGEFRPGINIGVPNT